ncbi:MAG: prepilin peptidase [Candidatus Omnitrophota bacterium]
MPESLSRVFVFVFGSIVGSFLNVCIYRLPLEQSVITPRSHCPLCKNTIRWYDNIPLLSYVFLRGKCRACKGRISIEYPLVELVTAFCFLFLYSRFSVGFVFSYYALFICGLIVASFVDIAHRIIPDEISVGGLGAGLLLNALKGLQVSPFAYNPAFLIHSFIGAVVGGGIIYLTGFLFDLVYFKLLKKPPVQGETESMGGGDVKLLAMIGAFLGWQKAVLVFFLAPILGLGVGIFNLLAKKDHTIPYGPFLSLAALLSIFWADMLLYALVWQWV